MNQSEARFMARRYMARRPQGGRGNSLSMHNMACPVAELRSATGRLQRNKPNNRAKRGRNVNRFHTWVKGVPNVRP